MAAIFETSAESEQRIQRAYYAQTASRYDEMHVHDGGEHYFALGLLRVAIEMLDVNSILDIGSGTGRTLLMLKEWRPGLRILGIEPSAELRLIGHQKGLSEEELIDGDARAIFPILRRWWRRCYVLAVSEFSFPTPTTLAKAAVQQDWRSKFCVW